MENLIYAFNLVSISVLAYMFLWFLVSVFFKRNDVADIAWGLGFLFIALLTYFKNSFTIDRGLIVTTLVSIWALRLSLHIFLRNKGKTEDYRYLKWRQDWGKWFYLRSFFQVYVLQGLLLILVASPVIVVNTFRIQGLNLLDYLGVIVWGFGFFFESVGDWQLSKFLKDPSNKGMIMDKGLWKYTRHPNYFGEVTQWWGIWLIALSGSYGFVGIVGPLTITYLILKVSGIPLLEKKMESNLAFQEYKRKTSVFFPLPPKN